MTFEWESLIRHFERVAEDEEKLQMSQVQLRRVAKILADFYVAPISMSSVQPVLDLAVELNPELKTRSRS